MDIKTLFLIILAGFICGSIATLAIFITVHTIKYYKPNYDDYEMEVKDDE